MSNWIHVAGNIRFDTHSDKKKDKKEIEKIFQVLGDIPEGSEGPLDIQILDVQPPTDNCVYSARYSVNIVGDLRDVQNFRPIADWVKGIKKRCIENDMWIRQGIVGAVSDRGSHKSWELLTIYKK